MSYKKKSRKVRRNVEMAVAHINSTFNNTLVSITTHDGDVMLQQSAGRLGFKGARKGTPYAASQVGATLARDMSSLGIKNVEVNLCGPGAGRDSVVRALQGAGIGVSVLRDVTPLPHNGTRARKRRRV